MKKRLLGVVGFLTLACLISGCLEEETRVTVHARGIIQREVAQPASEVSQPAQPEPEQLEEPAQSEHVDRAPVIIGLPFVSVTLNDEFVFFPNAWDPDNDPLQFSIVNKPGWIEFDELTGALSGFPVEGDSGTYPNVLIGVSDGNSTSYLDVTIEVVGDITHTVVLEWYPPTENTDDTPLMDLAGYRIRYGPDPDNHSHEIDIPNPGITSFVVKDVVAGTNYFVLSAYNTAGVESETTSAVIQL